ncbi:conserved exported hypothetical protein [Flavobacterium sp. 9AF]|uniref:hypothetical protein n=1 Tax=Flavobacterium sp. 9AF TaxID=2653142 RepID=UPI0012F300A1|nr:hypothetical protein [Flavobacterium sp. 9AF]VXC20073.1 conserved exported hypothetical protein [Flavobacterium sp. 9AF]
MRKYIVLLLLIASCKESAAELELAGNTFYFQKTQPINDSELKSFPNKFLGLYMNADSTYLNFKKDLICSEYIWRNKIPNTDLDSLKMEYDLTVDKIIAKDGSFEFSYRKLRDSIEIFNKKIDTIFRFSSSQKAKQINGNLVVSNKDSIYWTVKLFTFDKDRLTVKQLYSDVDLKKMDSITKVKSKMLDSSIYIISPSRSEFKQLFKVKNFGYNTNYKRVKE